MTTQQQKGTKGDTFPGTSCSYLPALLTDNSCLVSLFLLCCLSKINALFNILCVSILLSLRTTTSCSPYEQQLHVLLTNNSSMLSLRTTAICSPYEQQYALLRDNSMLSLRTTATCCPHGRKGSTPLREKLDLLSSRTEGIYSTQGETLSALLTDECYLLSCNIFVTR